MKEPDSYSIELYRGVDRKFFGIVPFLPIVKESLEHLLGRSLILGSIRILILQVPEEPLAMEPPIVENLVPAFGYTCIRVYQGNFLIYRHPHRLYDVVTRTLQKKLSNQYPEETYWGFRVDVPGMPKVSITNLNPQVSILYLTPGTKENLNIHPPTAKKKPNFKIRRLEEEEPVVKTLTDFGTISSQTGLNTQEDGNKTSQDIQSNSVELISTSKDGKKTEEKIITPYFTEYTESNEQTDKAPVKIVLKRSLYQDLCHQRPLSSKVEEGGFLIGKVYRDGDDEDIYLLEVSNALTAEHTGASFLHLTFTGDSFVEVKRTLNQSHPGERLLGWYHTHLFPATPNFGLSSIDVELHFSTFTIPWQLAGLINIDNNQRTLRFYARQGNKMVLCPYWVIDELGDNERH